MTREDRSDLAKNVATWAAKRDSEFALARRQWAAGEPSWGVFAIPEEVARILPRQLTGIDVVELGCGTGYVSAWLARRGARPIGADPTPTQLVIAQHCQREFHLSFPLVRTPSESLPFRDDSFDLAISEYGAAIWADPYEWIPEAARVLRVGGELIFLGNSTLVMLCAPDDESAATDRMLRPQFGMHRFEWSDDDGVEFHLSHGDWIRLLRRNGFEIEDLVELCPPADSRTDYPFVTVEWAEKWPCEEVWRARKNRV